MLVHLYKYTGVTYTHQVWDTFRCDLHILTHIQVWVDRDSNRSIIVELLDLDTECPDYEVVRERERESGREGGREHSTFEKIAT